MWTILQIELYKIFKRPRTYISFAAIAAIVILIQLALYLDGEKYLKFMLQGVETSFDFDGKLTHFSPNHKMEDVCRHDIIISYQRNLILSRPNIEIINVSCNSTTDAIYASCSSVTLNLIHLV